ncbi:uncharacterized protein LOC143227068 [Tachypleus tridentatus]|uniref:uncharacterized protein LOC143227068 n=1 Tax=Tachypleus tridentatus TaxID=6853 RepID=UPI003FD4279A
MITCGCTFATYSVNNHSVRRFVNTGIEGLSITSLSVPSFIENGTRAYVDLDCVYNFTEEDNYLVVKWYYNDDTSPIYQWIPELRSRRVSDKFQNRIDLSFSNTPFRFTKYRGFRILNPTTELSGKYSCHVTSANGIDDANKLMVIYGETSCLELPTEQSISYMLKGCSAGKSAFHGG